MRESLPGNNVEAHFLDDRQGNLWFAENGCGSFRTTAVSFVFNILAGISGH
jgi:hypothetical protein